MRSILIIFLLTPLIFFAHNYSLISFNNYHNPSISQDLMSFISSNITLRWNTDSQCFEKVLPSNDNLVLNYNNQINSELSSEKNGTIMHYYSDDHSKPWYEENYKKGKLYGTYKEWNSEGQLMRVTNYKNGVFHGDHKRFYRDGSIMHEFTFNKGTGIDKIYDPNGQLILEINYKDGLTDGSFTEYFPTGYTKTNGFFKEGKYHGEWRMWNYYNQLNYQFSFNEGRLDGVGQKWYDNGHPSFEGEFNDGKRNGSFSTYFDDGTLHSECGFINNTMSGLCIYSTKSKQHYEGTGDIYWGQWIGQRFEIKYKNGFKDGETKVYDEQGNLRSIETYLNDTLNGLQYYFLKDSTKIEHKYHKGVFDKRLKMFWPNGKLKIETHLDQPFTNNSWAYISDGNEIENFPLRFENGIGANLFYVEGAYNTWNENGQKLIDATFKKGKLNGEFKLWYDNGNLKSTGFKQDTLQLVEWKEYDKDGKLIGQASFDDMGKLKYADGIVIDYFKNFSIKSKKSYVKGIQEGEANYYNWKPLDNGQNNSCFKKENYKNGKLHGLLTVTMSDNSDDKSDVTDYSLIANYQNGVLSGEYEEYEKYQWTRGHRNNSKVGYYTNGLFTGKVEVKTFEGGGELNYSERIENYQNGKLLSGKYEEGLDDVGPLLIEHYTKKYLFDGTRKEWNDEGTLILEENFNKGKLHGIRKRWNDDGKLILEESYINGKLHGSKKEWSYEGKLILEENYINGEEVIDFPEIEVEDLKHSAVSLDSYPFLNTYYKTIYRLDEKNQDSILVMSLYNKNTDTLIEEFEVDLEKHLKNYTYHVNGNEQEKKLLVGEIYYKNDKVYLKNEYNFMYSGLKKHETALTSQIYYPSELTIIDEDDILDEVIMRYSSSADGFLVHYIKVNKDSLSKIHFHRDGNWVLEKRYSTYNTAKNNVDYKRFYGNILIEEIKFSNGLFYWTKWFPNGNYLHKSTLDIPETDNNFRHEMKSLARYLLDFIEDHESWQPLLKRYKEFRVGTTREWHSNGQLALEVNYVMGRKDGLEKRWYRNGERQSVVNYKMDSIVGDNKYWEKEGKKQHKGQKNIYSNGGEGISNYEWLYDIDALPWLGDGEKSSLNYQNTYRLRPFFEDDNKVPSVSSSQYTQDTLSEEVKKLFDEDPRSAWISADMQDNQFEYIEAYSFGDEITAFLNGDNSSIDNWKAYARVKRMRMYKLENGKETYVCDLFLKDLMGEQSVQGIPLSEDDRGSFIKLVILELYPGDKYNKVAISEIYH